MTKSEHSATETTLTSLIENIKAEDDTAALGIIRSGKEIALESDAEGRTALHYAAKVGREAVVKELLQCCADPNAQHADYRHTPLHLSAKGGHEATSKLLLEGRADPNAQNKFQRTPLHYAAQDGHEATVRLLLNAGADRTIVDKYGYTPRSLAVQNRRRTVINLFDQPQIFRKKSSSSDGDASETRTKTDVRRMLFRDREKERICKYFKGSLWKGDGTTHLSSSPGSVWDIVYGDMFEPTDEISWIHLPANNVSLPNQAALK
jgi:hypothetical protein